MRYLSVVLGGAAAVMVSTTSLSIAAGARSPQDVQRELDSGRQELSDRQRRAGVLSSDIRALNARLGRLDAAAQRLDERQSQQRILLQRHTQRLSGLQARLRSERATAARAAMRLSRSRRLLARRLVEIYKAGEPDLISMALSTGSWAQLFERRELLSRASRRDARTIAAVRSAKDRADLTARRLARVSASAQAAATVVQERYDALSQTVRNLRARRESQAAARRQRSATLRRVRDQSQRLETRVRALERESARVQRELQGVAVPGSSGGSGQLAWPVDGPLTSPFGQRWGRLHAGLDIAPPDGTPIRAAGAGTVVLAGPQGGYGNFTCVQHTSALTTCYAHQSLIQTRVGAQVARGDVIGAVGNTGNSTGPHLHFETRLNGSPVDPMSYL